jgi:membrane protease YdiL (CAAX protease family)
MNETALPVKPDKFEKKVIRAYYNKGGMVMVIFTVTHLLAQIFFGFIDVSNVSPMILQLVNMFLMVTIEVAAIAGGCFFAGLDWKSFFRSRDNYSGKTIFKTWVTTQGLGYLGVFLGLLFMVIIYLLGGSTAIPMTTAMGQDPGSATVLVIYGVLCAPILEEILCRGVILNGIKKYNKTMALVVSALTFGLIHGNAFQFAYAAIMGLVLGFVALKANSVIPTIFAHMSVNAVAFSLQVILSLSGINEFQEQLLGDGGTVDFAEMMKVSAEIPTSVLIAETIMIIYVGAMVIAAITLAVLGRKQFRQYVPKSNELGKRRGLPVFLTSPVWIIVLLFHIATVFVLPFVGGA